MNSKKAYNHPYMEDLASESDLSFLASTGTGGIPPWEDDGDGEIVI